MHLLHDKLNLRLFHADSWIFAHVAVYQAHTALVLGLWHASDTTIPDGQVPMQLLGRQLLVLETATLLVACTYAIAALNLRLFHTDSWTCAHVAAHRAGTALTVGLLHAHSQQQQLSDTAIPYLYLPMQLLPDVYIIVAGSTGSSQP